MRCLSCSREVTSRTAKLWNKKILVCAGCHDLADAALARINVAYRRAEAHALMELEQQILSGALLCPGSGMGLLGEPRDV